MLQYTNGFACVFNNDDNSFVIKFYQNVPILTENPDVIQSEAQEISSIVMSRNGAQALLKSLSDILNSSDN